MIDPFDGRPRFPGRPVPEDAIGDPFEPQVGPRPESNLRDEDLDTVTKTGTTIVGITTDEGVVMASDMRASLAGRIVTNKSFQKVAEIQPNAALSMSGSVGGAQSFVRTLRAEANLYEARRDEYMSIGALATMASNLLRGGPFFIVVPILAGVDDDGSHVYSLDPSGSSLEDDYTANGSGMPYALGVLEQGYDDDLTMDEAVTVAAQAIQSASERDTGSGNGIHVTRITRNEVDIAGYADVKELL